MSLDIKKRIESYFDRLWPLCRSITGPGYKQTLDILSEIMPIERLLFKTGQQVLDWTVPKEWILHDAYLIDPKGQKRADFKKCNLHVLNYSIPFKGKMPLSELRPHLYSLPEQPEAIPYLTSYYKENWGFCMSHQELESLPEGIYEVVIDAELKPGHIEIAETILKGESPKEILFSTYACHPSMANNELSGPLAMVFLYEQLAQMPFRRYTYRFVIGPETIGAICYLSKRGAELKKKLIGGYIMTCLGDRGNFTYKNSRHENALVDRIAKCVLRDLGSFKSIPFDPCGSDERQYSSPGYNLAMGTLMRTMYLSYPEYHTSLDNKDFIDFNCLIGSVQAYKNLVDLFESNATYLNTVSYGEPQLGKRGLFPSVGSLKVYQDEIYATMWVSNMSDGTNDLLTIAERSGKPFKLLVSVAEKMEKAGLLKNLTREKTYL